MRIVAALISAIMGLCLDLAPDLALGLASAHAEKRVALVIGNSDYQRVGALPNPVRDAAAMGELFRKIGFDRVDVKTNLDQSGLREALRDFSDAVYDADIAVVFYAGYGIEVNGANYLIPTDAMFQRDIDVEDEAVPLDRVSQIIEPARRLRLIILDACQDNPFVSRMRHVASRSIGRGFGRVDVAAADTIIAFAAKPGSIVADGNGANSPYTAALLHNLATPGLDIRLAMGRVRDEVLATTKRQQEPTTFTSLGGAEISLVPRAEGPAVQDAAGYAWTATKDTTNIAVLKEFVQRYGDGFYASLARARIEELENAKVAAVGPPNEKLPDGIGDPEPRYAATTVSPKCSALTSTPIFRVINTSTEASFLTSSKSQAGNAPVTLFSASLTGATGLVGAHRMYHISGDYFWTIRSSEVVSAAKKYGYVDQGIDFYVSSASADCTQPVYRFQSGGKHRFAVSQADRNALEASGWKPEGIMFYGGLPQMPTATRPAGPWFTLTTSISHLLR